MKGGGGVSGVPKLAGVVKFAPVAKIEFFGEKLFPQTSQTGLE